MRIWCGCIRINWDFFSLFCAFLNVLISSFALNPRSPKDGCYGCHGFSHRGIFCWDGNKNLSISKASSSESATCFSSTLMLRNLSFPMADGCVLPCYWWHLSLYHSPGWFFPWGFHMLVSEFQPLVMRTTVRLDASASPGDWHCVQNQSSSTTLPRVLYYWSSLHRFVLLVCGKDRSIEEATEIATSVLDWPSALQSFWQLIPPFAFPIAGHL